MGQSCYYVVNGIAVVGASHAVRVSAQTVVDALNTTTFARVPYPGSVYTDERFFVACAEHETNFAVNEEDQEDSGFTSRGIFQISNGEHLETPSGHIPHLYVPSEDETLEAGMKGCDLFDLATSVECLARLLGPKRDRLLIAYRFSNGGDAKVVPADLGAYMAIVHNEGLEAAINTVRLHGLDWREYKRRNHACSKHVELCPPRDSQDPCASGETPCTPYIAHIGAYGDACITGGSQWHTIR